MTDLSIRKTIWRFVVRLKHRLHDKTPDLAANAKPREQNGFEFSIVLLLTLCLGLLAAILATDEDHCLRDYLVDALDWSSSILAAVGIWFATVSSVTTNRWTTGAVVLFIVFSITGASSQLVGAHSPDVTKFRTATKEWSKKVSDKTERFAELTKTLEIARSEYDSCARQRDALKVQAKISNADSDLLTIETGKRSLRLGSFCDYEKLHFEAVSNFRNAADAELQISIAARPAFDNR